MSKKTTAKVEQTTATVETVSQGQTIAQTFIASAVVRMTDADRCKTIVADLNEFSKPEFVRQIDATVSRGFMTYEQLTTIAHDLAVTDKQDARFIALKVITKIRQSINALANNRKTFFDGYTVSILANLTRLQELSNKSALVSLSRSVEYHEDEQVADIRRVIDCSPSTASTQASSSRMMLRALGACNVQKRKAKDVISFTDSACANAIQVMFA
jgi:hypothetical protein